MGIHVTCPGCGKKLNVKAFLAGKRGVCPQCRGKFDIPLNAATTIEVDDDEDEIRAVPMPGPASLPHPAIPMVAAPVQPVAAPLLKAVPQPVPVASPAPFAAPAAPVVLTAPSPVMPATVLRDPIAEAPQANWYVRPPAGGQFGPAQGDVLRQWMQQRRVTPDSYLWRDGWPDWQRADVVFPALKPAPIPAPVQSQPMPVIAAPTPAFAAPAAAVPAAPRPTPVPMPAIPIAGANVDDDIGPRRSNSGRMIALGILVGAVMVLALLLVYVVTRP